jgi:Zn-dependent peptidase ImmA (M78 family)/transcriptional regulator with XRE-family HTH domain
MADFASQDRTGRVMLGTVRVARGMTQAELAKASGVSQAVLSKAESGLVSLDESRLVALAVVLGVPTSLLTLPVDEGATPYVFHRKRSTLPLSVANRLRAELEWLHLQVAGVVAGEVQVGLARHPLPPDGFDSPEEIAREVRSSLGVATGPVMDLVAALEAAGVIVIKRSLGSERIDAMVSWPEAHRPIVLLGDHIPPDRQRFSLAHELAHAVMHQVPSETQEVEADRFAAEFLMPAQDIRADLSRGPVTVPALAQLKSKWRVSIAALLRRAWDLDVINDGRYRQLNIELSRAGYRSIEPVLLVDEVPTLMGDLVSRRLELGESVADIARDAFLNEEELAYLYLRRAAA